MSTDTHPLPSPGVEVVFDLRLAIASACVSDSYCLLRLHRLN